MSIKIKIDSGCNTTSLFSSNKKRYITLNTGSTVSIATQDTYGVVKGSDSIIIENGRVKIAPSVLEDSFEGAAIKEWVIDQGYATSSWISSQDYASKTHLNQILEAYPTSADLNAIIAPYAAKEWVLNKFSSVWDDMPYATSTSIGGIKAHSTFVNGIRINNGFLEVDPSYADGGGHTILDPAGDTMPTQPALQFGDGFTVTDEEGKTVVGNTAASHIDGADEEKHTSNQITHESTPLSTILPQLVNLQDIDVSDINVGERKIIVVEKNAEGDPVFSGGVGLLDVIANPGLSTLLAETNPNWVGDEITLTGNNLDGQLGENSQFFELDADFFLCIAHNNGTTTSDGFATWKRNRGTDCLQLSIAAHVAIIDELEVEAGWNSVAQFKQITEKSKLGTWFRRSSGGYLYMCIDNNNGWTRIGPTPPTTDLEITSASHPVLTASLAAHDFASNRFYVEGTNPADEPAEQGQEWWDIANKYVYRRNMDGNWARLNG